jgi:hypothetical protein
MLDLKLLNPGKIIMLILLLGSLLLDHIKAI